MFICICGCVCGRALTPTTISRPSYVSRVSELAQNYFLSPGLISLLMNTELYQMFVIEDWTPACMGNVSCYIVDTEHLPFSYPKQAAESPRACSLGYDFSDRQPYTLRPFRRSAMHVSPLWRTVQAVSLAR